MESDDENPAGDERIGEMIAGRYELLEPIGRGGQGCTWLAYDSKGGQVVAVKELELARTPDWKTVELFEREGRVLAALDHPQIPAYVDAFHVDLADATQDGQKTAGQTRFFIVEEYVSGPSLADLLDEGRRFDDEELLDILEGILEILRYLHSQNPPVVHRDIKPANIVKASTGKLVLVDFGAVQSVLPGKMGGSTVVGTTGYLPPEQLMGRAQPSSDLYALGATAVHLAAGVHPAELDMQRNRLQYHDRVHLEPEVREFIDRLLEPVAEDRFKSAREALAYLRRMRRGEPEPQSAMTHTGRDEQAWLSREKNTVLVEHRATPRLRFQVALDTISRIDEGLERAPGQVVLDLMPEQVEMTFRSGMPTLRPEYTALGLIVMITLVLVIPMAWPAKIGSVLFLLAFGIVSARLFYRRAERKLVLTPQGYVLSDEGRVVAEDDLRGLERFEARDDSALVAKSGGRDLVLAGGLGPNQGRWLTARLQEGLTHLRHHGRLLDFDE